MNRKETTEFLSKLLVQRKLAGKYYASEVTLDFGCGKGKEKRVDSCNLYQEIKPQAELKKANLFSMR